MLKNIFYLNELGKRKNLEDCLFPNPERVLLSDRVFVVCDGVGGENMGEVASSIVCNSIGQFLSNLTNPDISKQDISSSVLGALKEMHAYAEQHEEAAHMSTTLTVTCLGKNGIQVAWCGDSRIYHIRNGRILWKSTDHSLVQALIDNGEITEQDAKNHPKKNVILRSVSASLSEAKIDYHNITEYLKGDYLLLCTDGILEKVSEIELHQILQEQQIERDKRKLFLEYCLNQTNDNYSMYLLELGSSSKSFRKKNIAVGLAFLLLIAWCGWYSFDKQLFKKSTADMIVKDTLQKANRDNLIHHSNQIDLPTLHKKTIKNR